MLVRKLYKRDVVTVHPDASVLEAARLMRAEHVGDVVVMGPERRPIGILTDRDIVVGVLAKDVEHLSMLAVKDVLTPDPVMAREDEDVETVLSRMRRNGVRRVPVIDREGALLGVFALDDVLGVLADDLSGVVSLIATERRREEAKRP
jgi:CBS domain-containing protein